MTFISFASRILVDILSFQVKASDHNSLLSYLCCFDVFSLLIRGLIVVKRLLFAVFFYWELAWFLGLGF
jgi:hypothetical protein